jgi:hypothetical protein
LVHSRRSSPLFAAIWVQRVEQSYYDPNLPYWFQENVDKRHRWLADVAEWEVLATEMTDRQLWNRIRILLVHVEGFRPNELIRIWPPEDGNLNLPPYPSHMNGPDSVVVTDDPDVEMVRLVLEHAGTPVYPRLFYQDSPENWPSGFLWPGLPAWVDRSPVGIEVHEFGTGQWVAWASEILRRIL